MIEVLDVGCGFGDTTIKLAQRVGSEGKVVGLDCCDAFLEYGRKDAARLGLPNVSFVTGDALLDYFEPEYDFVFSRFGTMFFANPVAGLRNMRTALKPGGIMTHIVWRTRNDNPWLSMAKEVVMNFLPPPGEDALTCGPGPFSMADETMVTKMMEIAGYGDITFRRVDAPVLVGKTVEDAIGFQLAIGPAAKCFGKQARRRKPSGPRSKPRWQQRSMLRRRMPTELSWTHRPGLYQGRNQPSRPVGNLIRLATEAELRNASAL